MKEFQQVIYKSREVPHLKRHYKDKSRFLFDFTKGNNRYRRRYTAPTDTITTMVEIAKSKCEKYWQDCDKAVATLSPTITVNGLWEHYKSKQEWSRVHRRNLVGQYDNHIKDHIGTMRASAVAPSDIDVIMQGVRHLSKSSQKRILEVLIPLFKLAVRSYIRDRSPIGDEHTVSRKAAEEKKIVHNAKSKYKQLHKAIHKLFKDDPKMRAGFLFGFYGRRLGEVLTLQWQDVDFSEETFLIKAENSKVNQDMIFGLPIDLLAALRELYNLKDSIWIFSSPINTDRHITRFSMHYDSIREETKMPEFHYHLMRNIMVSALAGEVNTSDLSALLGHTDATTLTKYLSLQREGASRKVSNASKKLLR